MITSFNPTIMEKLTINEYYEIAKIISNEFIGTLHKFTADTKTQYVLLNSNACDLAPMIRVYNGFDKIKVNGDYTDGWQSIQSGTMDNVKKYINTLTNKK